MADGMIKNKWNKMVRPFSAYSGDEKDELLDYAAGIAETIKEISGHECMIAYGTLLGATRERDFIPHDDDIDLAVFCGEANRSEVALSCKAIMEHFLAEGYEIKGPSYGQFKIFKTSTSGRKLKVEVFASWTERDRFYLYFAVPGAELPGAVAPLQKIDFLGRTFLAPNDPGRVLAAIYGEGWETPDPDFAYEMDGKKWAPFTPLFFSRNVKYWDSYYSAKNTNDVWAVLPSQFGTFVANELSRSSRVLEVGSGNGRDSVFFAQAGHTVRACDYSEEGLKVATALAEGRGVALETEVLNVYDIPSCRRFARENHSSFDVVYARFFVHAISPVGEQSFLETARDVLAPDGALYLEFRTVGDARASVGEALSGNERVDGHYRRFIEPGRFLERAKSLGFGIDYSVVGTGMAKFRDEDPEVCRAILTV